MYLMAKYGCSSHLRHEEGILTTAGHTLGRCLVHPMWSSYMFMDDEMRVPARRTLHFIVVSADQKICRYPMHIICRQLPEESGGESPWESDWRLLVPVYGQLNI